MIIISLCLIVSIYKIQKRQYYEVGNYFTITVWHDYIIFGRYTSFFYPDSDDSYIYLHSHPNSLTICFTDSTNYVLYLSSNNGTNISQKKFTMKSLFSGHREQYYNYLLFLQDFYTNAPLYEIEFTGEDGAIYIPSINVFYDSIYCRTIYEYSDFFMTKRDSSMYNLPLQSLLEENKKELIKWEEVILPNL